MTDGQMITALHTFGSPRASTRISSQARSVAKHYQKTKIGVQPEAVKRREIKNGTKRALKKGRPSAGLSSKLPVPIHLRKREHSFSNNVINNEAVPKKAGRTMSSKCQNKMKKPVCKTKLEKKD